MIEFEPNDLLLVVEIEVKFFAVNSDFDFRTVELLVVVGMIICLFYLLKKKVKKQKKGKKEKKRDGYNCWKGVFIQNMKKGKKGLYSYHHHL